MKAHGLLERIGKGYRYNLTDKGPKPHLMFSHKTRLRAADQLAVPAPPDETLQPESEIEAAYHKADDAIQQLPDLLAARSILRDEFAEWPGWQLRVQDDFSQFGGAV